MAAKKRFSQFWSLLDWTSVKKNFNFHPSLNGCQCQRQILALPNYVIQNSSTLSSLLKLVVWLATSNQLERFFSKALLYYYRICWWYRFRYSNSQPYSLPIYHCQPTPSKMVISFIMTQYQIKFPNKGNVEWTRILF